LSLAHGDGPLHFVICRRVKDLFFGSLGVDYFGFFGQWGYPLSQKHSSPVPPCWRGVIGKPKTSVLQLGTDSAHHQGCGGGDR